jgi:hypothetical protein
MESLYEEAGIDSGILPAVEILNKHGFITFESCQGGKGHYFEMPTVRFIGQEFDLIRAYEICECYGLNVYEAKRVYAKEDVYQDNKSEKAMPFGIAWGSPYNELTFVVHSQTKSIYRPR